VSCCYGLEEGCLGAVLVKDDLGGDVDGLEMRVCW
jgi:hypothetical protein